ncbi:ion channel [Thalassobellus sediminis]|uniref:ion channel n=1 Tax=Thalassobellus sediminis TaxID=3367753 RepID=UPI0037A4AF1A
MAKKIKDPGLGNASSLNAKRMMNSSGAFNIQYVNKSARFSEAYHYLVNISWLQFFVLTFAVGFFINSVFAIIYLVIGIEEIIPTTGSIAHDFLNAFFFSMQTFTTLGYGSMSPGGIASGIVSSIEAFIGLMLFAFATGLIYGRFSKPKAAVRFSKHIVLRDFNKNRALMFRLVNNRKTTMIRPKIAVTLSLTIKNSLGNYENNFYTLKLERDTISYLPTTWTIVHELDEESPLFNFSNEEIIKMHGEFIIMISYYDESFNQEVHQMHSYVLSDALSDFKFKKAYYYNDNGKLVLDYKLFDAVESFKS